MSCYQFDLQSKGQLSHVREFRLYLSSINSSFKEKDNEDGGKSKAFEPNVQISYEELIININKYVL